MGDLRHFVVLGDLCDYGEFGDLILVEVGDLRDLGDLSDLGDLDDYFDKGY